MIRVILFIICFAVFSSTAFAQERDILDFAAKNPRASQVQNPDGTWRTPKYGDYDLEQAIEKLKNYSQPFTVPRVISWYSEAKDGKIRAALLRVLAVSRDPRAALVLGNSLKDDSLDVRVAATYGLMDYFLPSVIGGGTEQHMLAVQKWWEENRERLEKEAKCVESEATANNSMDVRAKQRLCYRRFLVNSELRVGGFAPRHLNRSASSHFGRKPCMLKFLNKKSPTVEAKLLDAGIIFGKYPLVKELFYDLETLVITLDPDISGKLLKIVFSDVRGFRCLEEGDLLNFWESKFITDNWLFEITAGGWLDQEDKREGFLSKTLDSYREFFICSIEDCVSVLSISPPAFEILDVALNPES